MSARTPDDLLEMLRGGGAQRYDGEDVTQLEHALQTAELARAAGAAADLIVAALFHDVGHLVLADGSAAGGRDQRHERIGERLVARCIGEAVSAPVRLHVDAKRYLCRVERGYEAALSAESRRSLALQGGAFSVEEAAAFVAQAGAADAIALRRWDDQAKVVGARVPSLGELRSLVLSVAVADPMRLS